MTKTSGPRKTTPATAALSATAASSAITLRILATSDLHMNLLPWDYFTDKPSRSRGLSLIGGLIAQARAEVPLSVLVDNGDFLQGSPLGDLIADSAILPADAVHPMIAAMNHLSYDAACLGNHEFSHGVEFLERSASKANFPILSANMLTEIGSFPESDQPFFPATALLTRMIDLPGKAPRPLKIGLVGLTPSQVVHWEREVLKDRIKERPILVAAKHQLAQLRKSGADLVIALAHSGLGAPQALPDQENTVIRLARELDFDAIIAGHTHNVFPGPDFSASDGFDPEGGLIAGIPVLMPGFYGSHLGVIDLALSPMRGGGWSVVSNKVSLRPVFKRGPSGQIFVAVKEDPAIRAIAAQSHARARRWARRKIGESACPLTSHFSLIAPSQSTRIVTQAQADHVSQTLRGSVWEGLPIVSAAAPFRTGGRSGPENYTEIPAGPLTLRNIADVYSFPNTIIALLMTGAQLKDWLERAAALFFQIVPGAQDQPLIDPEMPGFDYDQIDGLDYVVDLSRPARYDAIGRLINPQGGRITDLMHDGAALDMTARFVMATNSYRLGGGGGYVTAGDRRVLMRGGQSIRAILAAYVARLGNVGDDAPPNWRFAPMPGTTVSFLSAPSAYPSGPDAARLLSLGQTAAGFQKFRLSL
jgi:2',3'-cyclic-nucleotide 2'-phosphodiesterase/3'-nucleotidase